MFRQRLADLQARRARSDPLPRGIAPFTSSYAFRGDHHGDKAPARRWDDHLSIECRNRKSSTLKAASSAKVPLDTISLGTARPNPKYFPWTSLESTIDCLDGVEVAPSSCKRGEDAYDLSVAMNYGHAVGSPQLLRFVTEHVEMLHDPPFADWEICLTCGTTSALEIIFRMLCNRGDWLLTEAHSYSGAIEAAKGLGLQVAGVPMDEDGLCPNELDSKLDHWDATKGPKPSVLYTIPSGHNPTGTTQSLARRRAVLEVAERHNLLIIEDDPYHLLQLGLEDQKDGEAVIEAYVAQLPASYLSLDTAGRVIRLESTSKILAPGLRLGWMTASSQLINHFLSHTEFGAVSPSGPSQVMTYKLLDETWGHEGFFRWLTNLSRHYSQRRDHLLDACRRYLPADTCSWNVPATGMFIWISLSQASVQKTNLSPAQVEDSVYCRARQNGVGISKGSWFGAGEEQDVCFRLTFAAAPEDRFSDAVERFGNALRHVMSPTETNGV